MPFQSEKQRRYMHANLPKIANRWERKYGMGGIAELNAELNQLPEYYLPATQGGRVPAHQAGVLGLAEGGRTGFYRGSDRHSGTTSSSSSNSPGHPSNQGSSKSSSSSSKSSSSSSNQGSDRGHSRFDVGSGYYGEPTTPSTPDDSGDDDKALSYVNWNQPTIDDTKDSDSAKKKKILQHLGNASGVNLNKYIYGIEQPQEKKSKGKLVFDTLFAIATGGLSLTEKLGANFVKNSIQSSFKKQEKTKDLINSLPINHPERISLEASLYKKPPDGTSNGDGVKSIKIEDIETVNQSSSELAKLKRDEEMNMAAFLAYLDQQRRREAYLNNYRQMFLANKGGLAGLFRLKNS